MWPGRGDLVTVVSEERLLPGQVTEAQPPGLCCWVPNIALFCAVLHPGSSRPGYVLVSTQILNSNFIFLRFILFTLEKTLKQNELNAFVQEL